MRRARPNKNSLVLKTSPPLLMTGNPVVEHGLTYTYIIAYIPLNMTGSSWTYIYKSNYDWQPCFRSRCPSAEPHDQGGRQRLVDLPGLRPPVRPLDQHAQPHWGAPPAHLRLQLPRVWQVLQDQELAQRAQDQAQDPSSSWLLWLMMEIVKIKT